MTSAQAGMSDVYAGIDLGGTKILVVIADAAAATPGEAEEENEIVSQIKELLETRVRPAVAMDPERTRYRGWRPAFFFAGGARGGRAWRPPPQWNGVLEDQKPCGPSR